MRWRTPHRLVTYDSGLPTLGLDARAPREGSGGVEGLVEWTLEESFL